MNIEIDQTLHGYDRGHQLLASSTELTVEEEKLLLFQSDLTGSGVNSNFKIYYTGYPNVDKGWYAFCKTWYAEEMKRPGCVWTHSLVIKFSDLGKIPELKELVPLFTRPIVKQYESFSQKIVVNLDKLLAAPQTFDANSFSRFEELYSSLYVHPEKTVILPVSAPYEFEASIFDLWSGQWPRLRRNFMFCTGALGLKSLNEREFDLQLVPEAECSSIIRTSLNPYLPSPDDGTFVDGFDILLLYDKNELREFLWTFGADIPGERKFYLPLLRLFILLKNPRTKLQEVIKHLEENFPNSDDAANLKIKLFSNDIGLQRNFDELELVKYLIENKASFIDLTNISLEKRLAGLIQDEKVKFEDLNLIWHNAYGGRLSESIWQYVNLRNIDLIPIWEKQSSLIETFIGIDPELGLDIRIWQGPNSIQEKVFNALLRKEIPDWHPFIAAMLMAESYMLGTAVDKFSHWMINYTLDWLNGAKDLKISNQKYFEYVANKYQAAIMSWVHKNTDALSMSTLYMLFSTFERQSLLRLHLSVNYWIYAYRTLSNYKAFNKDYVAGFLLSLSLTNELRDSDLLASEVFMDLYSSATKSELTNNIWNFIPKEEIDDENEISFMESIIILIGLNPAKKKYQVQPWDYCEILVRTVSTKFIKNYWSAQSFLSTFNTPEAFNRAISYLLFSKKGIRYFEYLKNSVESSQVQAFEFQDFIFRQMEK